MKQVLNKICLKAGKNGRIFNKLLDRPYTASQWYNEEILNMELVGIGVDGLGKSSAGDIIIDGEQVGIISDKNKTISATHKEVVENDWGWREENKIMLKFLDIIYNKPIILLKNNLFIICL